MRHYGRADSVRVVGDEDGYHLVVETDEGDRFDFRMSQDIANELAFAQTVGVRLHFEEGQNARNGPACSENGILGVWDDDIDVARDSLRGK